MDDFFGKKLPSFFSELEESAKNFVNTLPTTLKNLPVLLPTPNIGISSVVSTERIFVNDTPITPRPLFRVAVTIPNSQISIRTCILYEHLHGKNVGQAYESFCDKVGNGVIDLRSFEFWFNRFRTGNHDLDYDIDSELEPRSLAEMHKDIMRNILRELNSEPTISPGPSDRYQEEYEYFPVYNQLKELIQELQVGIEPVEAEPVKQADIDKKVLRGYILFECLQGNSTFEAYEKLCDTVGKNVVKYWEFEHWYQKIEAGDSSMESDIDFGKEIRSLSTMPKDIAGEIMNKLGLKEKLVMRKVSKNLRHFMDNLSIDVEKISLKIYNTKSILQFDENEIIYLDRKDNCNVLYDDQEKLVKSGNYAITALNDWSVVMKNKKLKLKVFQLFISVEKSDHQKIYKTMNTVLRNSNCSYIEKITLEGFSFSEVAKILRNFKSGILQEIVLGSPTDNADIEKLVDMRQWKEAKNFESSRNCIMTIPIENLFHFSRFDVSLKSLSKSDAILIREKLLKSSDFEHGCFRMFNYDPIDILNVFEQNYSGGSSGSITYRNEESEFRIQFDTMNFETIRIS
ncbi:F-box domain-containing protein [Caenorhabditis elegans]|uniref:F-box domain-containing protein n=1 Tax=Caenorhabditis elegans TaxID=6239 RepID=Q9XU28_CAEEL|nr:F-box domain-containing protein [Caenorhabditis elegans]CAB07208.1 F-box domain-containing protein [Caenorhabditis elegans]|eukprot:NP_507392.1 F-box A protein [Caenorhabditis elegans]